MIYTKVPSPHHVPDPPVYFPPPGCAGCASEERLFHKLFSKYNRFIRPVQNVSDPVTVYFEVAITQLANVVSAVAPRWDAQGVMEMELSL